MGLTQTLLLMLLFDEGSDVKMSPIEFVFVIIDSFSAPENATDGMYSFDFILTFLAAVLVSHCGRFSSIGFKC